ncbi:MAG: hypothetical protein ISS01_02080 [Nanoarchaeota archaeon]|nr:hypothetical protein [Nanoarchaeota archaeon]
MSFFIGIKRWFKKKIGRSHKTLLINSINTLIPKLDELLKNINTDVGKYQFRTELDKSMKHVNQFEVRLNKIKPEERALIETRAGANGHEFFTTGAALISTFKVIYSKIRDKVKEKDKVDIKNTLSNIESQIIKLDELVIEINNLLIPREFDKSKAKSFPGSTGRTTDGISIADITSLAKGFGFNIRRGAKHRITIDFEDGQQPCSLGTTTDFDRHVLRRLTLSTGRDNKEIITLLRAI